MILFKKAEEITRYILELKSTGTEVGFVPTMGALHQGHLSLIEAAKKNNAVTVCSIFVNPTQFNNQDDFKHYPVTVEKDIELLLTIGCDILFLPSKEEIYPAGYMPKHYELGKLENIFEGYYRPGHFQGVCQVVDRLLQIVQPNRLYMGAKDYQQCKVIAKLLAITGRDQQVNLSIIPTLREVDGLAMSSRNLRLDTEQRVLAPLIFQNLSFISDNRKNKTLSDLANEGKENLEKNGFDVDYLTVVDADTLGEVNEQTKERIVLVAAAIGSIRLIDNLLLN